MKITAQQGEVWSRRFRKDVPHNNLSRTGQQHTIHNDKGIQVESAYAHIPCMNPQGAPSRGKVFGTIALFCLFVMPAFGADTCPTGANYGTNGNQTLAAAYGIGANSCIYVSTSGSNSNNGNKATPCLLPLATANSASVCGGINLSAGSGVIFKGGETWHFGNSGASPYTGGAINVNDKNWLGNSSNQIYYGIDKTWFTGGSWTRPVFDGDNALTTSKVLGACSFQILNPLSSQKNVFWYLSNISWSVIDNIEMKGICAGATASNDGNSDAYFLADASHDMTFIHNYIHGYSHQQFSATCSTTGLPCIHMTAFRGGNGTVSSTTAGNNYLLNVVDGTDSDPAGWGACFFCDWYNAAYSYYGHITEGTPTSAHVFHDNIMEYWYDPGDLAAHGNVFESHSDSQVGRANAFYNNVIRQVSPLDDPRNQVGIWPQPCTPLSIGLGCDPVLITTDYFFNNVEYDVDGGVAGNYFNIGQNSNSGDQGPLVILNNTWHVKNNAGAGVIYSCNATTNHPFTSANNLFVTDAASQYSSPCTGGTFITELKMSNATATSNGYTDAQAFAFSPTSAGSPTVGAGTNKQSVCTTLLGNSDAFIQAAGTACKSDTTYACTYDSVNHVISECPARTPVLHSVGGAWSQGAYEFSNAAPPPPPAPAVNMLIAKLSWKPVQAEIDHYTAYLGTDCANLSDTKNLGNVLHYQERIRHQNSYAWAITAVDVYGQESPKSKCWQLSVQ